MNLSVPKLCDESMAAAHPTPVACSNCHKHKVKCEVGFGPCKRCTKFGLACTYIPTSSSSTNESRSFQISGRPNRGGPARACLCCRKIKSKCDAPADGSPCKRCTRLGFACVYPIEKKRGSEQATDVTHQQQTKAPFLRDTCFPPIKMKLSINLNDPCIPRNIAMRGNDFYSENYCCIEDYMNLIRSRQDLWHTVNPSILSMFGQLLVSSQDLGGLASCLNLATACGFSYEDIFPSSLSEPISNGGGSFTAIMKQMEADAAVTNISRPPVFKALPLETASLPACLSWVFEKVHESSATPRIVTVECTGPETYTCFVSQECEQFVETIDELYAEFQMTKKIGSKAVGYQNLPDFFRHTGAASQEVYTSSVGASVGSVHSSRQEKPLHTRLWSRIHGSYQDAVVELFQAVTCVGPSSMTHYWAMAFRFVNAPAVLEDSFQPPSTSVVLKDFAQSSQLAVPSPLTCRQDGPVEDGGFQWDEIAELLSPPTSAPSSSYFI
mmetsp:Transcript_47679/g.94568  ORF Transcript_47679/g.94568 Transcript_47679/m.94568 type:complete len:496 (+) Transcript_47679:68-1555(+)